MLSKVLPIATVLTCFALPSFAQEPMSERFDDYKTISTEKGSMQQFGQQCPIRLRIPLSDLLAKKKGGRLVLKSTAGVHCGGALVPKMTIKLERGRYMGRQWIAQGDNVFMSVAWEVLLPKGQDKLVTGVFTLVSGDDVLGEQQEQMEADEGELNWESGVSFFIEGERLAHPRDTALLLSVQFEARE